MPDFGGDRGTAIETVLASAPDVFNHNVETAPRLYPVVRPQADYRRSLGVLAMAKEIAPFRLTKSGLMVGLGETQAEVHAVLVDLKEHGCDVVTIGQYLRPRLVNVPVAEYVHPDVFARYEEEGKALGFRKVFSGPLVRSSFFAETVADQACKANRVRSETLWPEVPNGQRMTAFQHWDVRAGNSWLGRIPAFLNSEGSILAKRIGKPVCIKKVVVKNPHKKAR